MTVRADGPQSGDFMGGAATRSRDEAARWLRGRDGRGLRQQLPPLQALQGGASRPAWVATVPAVPPGFPWQHRTPPRGRGTPAPHNPGRGRPNRSSLAALNKVDPLARSHVRAAPTRPGARDRRSMVLSGRPIIWEIWALFPVQSGFSGSSRNDVTCGRDVGPGAALPVGRDPTERPLSATRSVCGRLTLIRRPGRREIHVAARHQADFRGGGWECDATRPSCQGRASRAAPDPPDKGPTG